MPFKETVEIFVLFMPMMERPDWYFVSFKDSLNELCDLSGKIKIIYNSEELCDLSISKYKDGDFPESQTEQPHYYYEYCIKFSASILKPENDTTGKYEKFVAVVESYVLLIIIYANIAKPGAFNTYGGQIRIKNSNSNRIIEDEFPMLVNNLALGFDIYKKYSWPPIKEYKIEDVFNWLKQHWISFEKSPGNKIQIALNAFSYLFHDTINNQQSADLLYSMIGIEALYVEGDTHIQRQIVSKSQLVLGQFSNFKKVIGNLYDFRSKFIHGVASFSNRYALPIVDKNLNIYSSEEAEQARLASLILLASIQKCFEMNIDRLEFDYIFLSNSRMKKPDNT